MSLLRSLPLLALATCLAAAVPAPAVHAGGDVIPPKTLGRKFPTGTFCALPVTVSFTPPTPTVVVHFDARVFIDNQGTPTWTGQFIDNIVIATTAQVSANFGPATSCNEFAFQQNCYFRDDFTGIDHVNYFYFNRPGLTFASHELFDTHPGPRGWDLSNGAYYIDAQNAGFNEPSAPRNPETCGDVSGGSLGLGLETTPPSLDEVATTSVEISGLVPGTSYDLTGWWNADFTLQPNTPDILTIRIERQDGTPITRKSWGSLKAGYKR